MFRCLETKGKDLCAGHMSTKTLFPQIKSLKKSSGSDKLGKEVLDDIEKFQWFVTQKSFEVDYNSLEDKYLKGNYNPKGKKRFNRFFNRPGVAGAVL